jgi:SPX domain protein involved in polyphosphate accumulation
MKFAQALKANQEELPELRDLFLSYKQLKKKLKKLPERAEGGDVEQDAALEQHEADVASFVETMRTSVEQFNERFMEREEESIIRLQQLEEQAEHAVSKEDCCEARRRLIDFHGETLLFFHWSCLAYTGLVKILKKYTKRTGKLVCRAQASCLYNLLQQPFCSTEARCHIHTCFPLHASDYHTGTLPVLPFWYSQCSLRFCFVARR